MNTTDIINSPVDDYNHEMLAPYMSEFYNNPFRRTYEDLFLSIITKLSVYTNYYMSDSYIQKLVETAVINNQAKRHKQAKQKDIKTTVRSYRENFQRFNTPSRPTYFDQTPDGRYVRAFVNCKTKRDINPNE